MNWQPIETAPKGNALEVPNRSDPKSIDPPQLLLYCSDGIFVGHYDFYYHPGFGAGAERGESPWRCYEGLEIPNPTHWMPLPAPPSTPEKLRDDGWTFDFDPETQFITATHRFGGKFSVAEIRRLLLKHEDFVGLGQSITAFLNGNQP